MPTFEEICFTYRVWVLAYTSPTVASPLYLVWYTDTDEQETDRLLTFQTGEIAAIPALCDLPTRLTQSVDLLTPADPLRRWLTELAQHKPVANSTYDLRAIERALERRHLSGKLLEGLANFVNLFSDYVSQDERNSGLAVYWKSEPIEQAWYYFYDYIFWPRFNNTEQHQTHTRPAPEFNYDALLEAVVQLRQQFEQRLKRLI